MSGCMQEMCHVLQNALKKFGNKQNWSHVTNQIGMFAFMGQSEEQVKELRESYHIYMTMDGRISIADLNNGNLD